MDLNELGQQLLRESEYTSIEWESLVAKALDAISRSEDIQELTSFFRMGLSCFPEEIGVATLERLLNLGDLSRTTLRVYVAELGLYFVKQGLYQWLFGELKQLEATNGTTEQYRELGEEVLRRLRDTNVDG